MFSADDSGYCFELAADEIEIGLWRVFAKANAARGCDVRVCRAAGNVASFQPFAEASGGDELAGLGVAIFQGDLAMSRAGSSEPVAHFDLGECQTKVVFALAVDDWCEFGFHEGDFGLWIGFCWGDLFLVGHKKRLGLAHVHVGHGLPAG